MACSPHSAPCGICALITVISLHSCATSIFQQSITALYSTILAVQNSLIPYVLVVLRRRKHMTYTRYALRVSTWVNVLPPRRAVNTTYLVEIHETYRHVYPPLTPSPPWSGAIHSECSCTLLQWLLHDRCCPQHLHPKCFKKTSALYTKLVACTMIAFPALERDMEPVASSCVLLIQAIRV